MRTTLSKRRNGELMLRVATRYPHLGWIALKTMLLDETQTLIDWLVECPPHVRVNKPRVAAYLKQISEDVR